MEQYNLIVVVGAQEAGKNTVTVRPRDAGMASAMDDVLAELQGASASGSSDSATSTVTPKATRDDMMRTFSCDHLVDICSTMTRRFK